MYPPAVNATPSRGAGTDRPTGEPVPGIHVEPGLDPSVGANELCRSADTIAVQVGAVAGGPPERRRAGGEPSGSERPSEALSDLSSWTLHRTLGLGAEQLMELRDQVSHDAWVEGFGSEPAGR